VQVPPDRMPPEQLGARVSVRTQDDPDKDPEEQVGVDSVAMVQVPPDRVPLEQVGKSIAVPTHRPALGVPRLQVGTGAVVAVHVARDRESPALQVDGVVSPSSRMMHVPFEVRVYPLGHLAL
ncbi:MAG: hypothetical protein OXE45_01235, partial [bacterium]|nr:hypothetical protein [bacterium]